MDRMESTKVIADSLVLESEPNIQRITRVHRPTIFRRCTIVPGSGPCELERRLIESGAAGALHDGWICSEPTIDGNTDVDRGQTLLLQMLRQHRVEVIGIRKS
jgi:hypothetical protein